MRNEIVWNGIWMVGAIRYHLPGEEWKMVSTFLKNF
jgi:hypothetical protein